MSIFLDRVDFSQLSRDVTLTFNRNQQAFKLKVFLLLHLHHAQDIVCRSDYFFFEILLRSNPEKQALRFKNLLCP